MAIDFWDAYLTNLVNIHIAKKRKENEYIIFLSLNIDNYAPTLLGNAFEHIPWATFHKTHEMNWKNATD
jgi:hypothetical protein